VKQSRPNKLWHSVLQCVVGISALALVTLVCFRFQVNSTTVALLYLIVIVLVSLKSTLASSSLVSIIAYLCLDYYFTEPLFTLGLNQTLDFVAPIAYVATAFVITRLMSKVRKS
jgi:K+-sensing histidine kinase KdpD